MALHLAKPTPKAATLVAAAPAAKPSSAQQALDAEKQQIAAARAQLDKDRAALDARQQQASAAPTPGPDAPPAPDTGAKLIALYGTMDPDDIAHIFAKLPDPLVVTDPDADGREKGRQGLRRPAARPRRPPERDHGVSRAGASGVNRCRTCSGVRDPIASVFSRLLNPAVTDTSDFGTPSKSATNAQQAAFAAPSIGGAVSRRCSTPSS